MPNCYLCEESREFFINYFCKDCSKLKRTISLYGKRVHEVVETVLIRQPEQQKLKINKELHKEEQSIKAYNLRSTDNKTKPILNSL